MAYERYPREGLSGDNDRRGQRNDRSGYYGARDDDGGFTGQRYAQGDRNDWRGDYRAQPNDQRGYYSAGSAGDVGDRGARYGGRYGDDYSGYDAGAPSRTVTQGDRSQRNYGRAEQYRGQQQRQPDYNYDERGFLSRAGDEVRSWFGDDDAERRRELDQRYDQRYARDDERDQHYHSWRAGQIAALDRDYDEYRRENQQKFHNEFGSWRTDRQGQRSSLSRVEEHMDVVGSDGEHIGTVDKVRGDRVILTKSDADAGGRHHSIPSRWIDTVDGKVTVRKTAAEAKSAWRDEERGSGERGAFFNDGDADADGHILNRSFSGTYR